LARQALEAGEAATTILNAANEVAVTAFLDGRLSFGGISALVTATLERSEGLARELTSTEDALAVDHDTRLMAAYLLPEIAAKAS
jgi:1-deoxy-D-xylulose-5-phosphate reductoisomerase